MRQQADVHGARYRQLEYTFTRVISALAKPTPDGTPSEALSEVLDAMLEASVQAAGAPASRALAVDWTDHESFSRPPAEPDGPCADPEASWGREEDGPEVPELVRRIHLAACHVDPPPALVAVLGRMVAAGITLGDLLADTGYSYRIPAHGRSPPTARRPPHPRT